MIALFESKGQFSTEFLSYTSRFFKEEIQPVFWGESSNAHDFNKPLLDDQKEVALTSENATSFVLTEDYIDENTLMQVISNIEQSSQLLPPLVFDQVTWSIFQQYIPVIPVISSLNDISYDEVKKIIEKSPMIYFVNQEDYLIFRDDYVNIAWFCHRRIEQAPILTSSLFRISRQTNRKELFKGLALTQKLKELNLPIRGIVCDEDNPEMLLLVQSYFPELPVIAADDINLEHDLSLYLYELSNQMISQLKYALFFRNQFSSLKNENLYCIDISNRDLDTIGMILKDSLVNGEKYQLINDQKEFEKSWRKAEKLYADETICVNTIEEIIRIDESKIKLNGYVIFDRSVMHKEFNLQVMLIHKSTKNAFPVATTIQTEKEKIHYSVEINFKDLDFFKGKFEVVVCYNSWNLQIQENASYKSNFPEEPIISLFVFSRNIEALVDDEEKLFFQVSAYQVDL